ncbi:ribonuclease MC-like [Argentina anserina]|uniref:ribonuclease MC-like n=1 Tax=Argentina anserina TaxID=57926 RepID=UPI0021767F28|nr:ribonuclease MC-like [Potentilla anserina]
MKNSNFILFLSVYVLVQVLQVSNAEPYDYMQFVLQYPPGLCYSLPKGQCISPLPTKFTIHGIWPSNNSGIFVTCPKALAKHPFVAAQITTPLKVNLSKSWPSVLKSKTNLQFWQHEYEKHGACAVESGTPPLTQKSYFERGDQLWNLYDIYGVLNKSGIKPNATSPYNMTQLLTPIKTKIGSNPVIKCKKSTNKYVLQEVIICMDHQAKKILTCPSSIKTNCQDPSGKIYYVA